MRDLHPNLKYYQPSGTSPAGGVLVTLLGGMAAGSILAAVYAFLNHHDPLIYLNVLLTVVFAFSLGWIVSKGVRVFCIRNVSVAAAIGIIVFVTSYLIHWFFYLATLIIGFETDSSFDLAAIAELATDLLRNPRETLDFIRILNSEGVWNLESTSSSADIEVKGVYLSAIWAAEALVICHYAVKMPMSAAGEPFSERLGRWITPTILPVRVAFIEDQDSFKNAVSRSDYSAITTPLGGDEQEAARGKRSEKYAEVTLYPDPFEPCVSIRNVEVKITKKAKRSSSANVVSYLKIPPTVAQSVSDALTAIPVSQ
jgi:hypothetical protein